MKNDTKRVFVPNNRATRALIAVFVFVSVVQPVLSGLSSQYPDYQAEFGEQTGTRYWLLLAYQAYWTVACSISGTVGNMFAVYLFRILGLNIRKLMNIQLAGQSSTSGTGSNSQIESEARAQASRRRTDATRIMITIGGVCAAFYANGGIALILCVWRVPIQSHAEGTVALAAIYWLVTPFMCVVHHIGCFYFAYALFDPLVGARRPAHHLACSFAGGKHPKATDRALPLKRAPKTTLPPAASHSITPSTTSARPKITRPQACMAATCYAPPHRCRPTGPSPMR